MRPTHKGDGTSLFGNVTVIIDLHGYEKERDILIIPPLCCGRSTISPTYRGQKNCLS